MSVAFTKEDSAETASETLLPDRPVSSHPNLVTEAGLRALEFQLQGSSILRARHCPRKAPISISTMLTPLACLGVWWNSIRRKICLASAGENV